MNCIYIIVKYLISLHCNSLHCFESTSCNASPRLLLARPTALHQSILWYHQWSWRTDWWQICHRGVYSASCRCVAGCFLFASPCKDNEGRRKSALCHTQNFYDVRAQKPIDTFGHKLYKHGDCPLQQINYKVLKILKITITGIILIIKQTKTQTNPFQNWKFYLFETFKIM